MNANTPLSQMTFKALHRVVNLGQDVADAVFDRELSEWYHEFLDSCDPEQRKEYEDFTKCDAAVIPT